MPQAPLISVIIINYNGMEFLKRCISSLLITDYENFEIIFVDNGSTDDSVKYLSENFKDKRISLVLCEKNYGVPGGRNIGFKKSKGKYIVFLDNDTEVDSKWLKELVIVFESDSKIAVAQCKLLNMVNRDKFDHAGDYLTPFGFLYERSNQSIDQGQFDKIADIFNAKGAATMVKASIFKELGMYDDSYFMYLEETDFCFRAWLAGYRVVFVPNSLVWHAFETPMKDKKKYYSNFIVRYYGSRNYITTLLKNVSLLSLLKILPFHIISWTFLSISFIIRGKIKDAFWILGGIAWNIANLPNVLKKRNYVQKNIRKVKDKVFFDKVVISKNISFYFKKASCYLNNKPLRETN